MDDLRHHSVGRAGAPAIPAQLDCLGYRHAITWIRHAESVLRRPLVVRHAGGTAGGGSGLTADAVALVRSYRRVSRAIDRVVRRAETEILRRRPDAAR